MKLNPKIAPESESQSSLPARLVIGASVLTWLLALAFIAVLVAALPAEAPTAFWMLLRAHDVQGALAGVGVLGLAWPLSRLFARCDWTRIAEFIARYLWPLCGLAFGFYAALAFWAYHHYPLAMDEYCPLTQSRIFLTGQTKGWVAPELLTWIMARGHRGEFFAVAQKSGFFTPTYWPGLAILLTPFTALGVPWICNPLLGALALAGVHRLAFQLSGSRGAAAWAWVLMLCSPVVAINAASFYSMPAHLLFNVVYSLLLLRDDKRGALAAGLIGGFALILHNPAPHLAFSLPWIGFVLWKRRPLLAPLLVGYAVFALPLGLGWSVWLGGFDSVHHAESARAAAQTSPFAGLLERLMSVVKPPSPLLLLARAAGLAKTVVWAVPGLLVVAWLGWRETTKMGNNPATKASPSNSLAPNAPAPNGLASSELVTNASDVNASDVNASDVNASDVKARALRRLCLSLLATLAIYLLVPFDQGHGWGFRYLHSAWFVLPVVGGVFLARYAANTAVRPYFAALCALSLLVLVPFRARQVETFIAAHLAQVPAPQSPVSLSFIDGAEGTFTVDLLHNDPFLRNNNWRLISRGAARNEALARKYLTEPKREQSGKWGEIWSGRALRHPTQK